MSTLKPLIYFVLGIAFVRYILPFFDILISWFQTAIEHRKMKIALKNVKLEKRMDEIVNDDKVTTRQIGFIVENPDEYKTEEEEIDEK